MDLKDLQIKVGGVQGDVTDIALSPEHSKKRTLNSTDMSMTSSATSQSSKSIFPRPSKKLKEKETISKNNKNPEIDALLEAAALANDVSGTGDQFLFSFCMQYDSLQNEAAKIKSSMKFVSQYVSEAEMKVLKLGNPGADGEKIQSLKKICADIKKKVVEELMKQVGKDKPGSKETFTVISIDSKLKFIRKGRAGAA